MCNCEFNDEYFYMFDDNGNFGKGESLRVDSDGIEHDRAVYSKDSGSIQTIKFNYCPMCGSKY